jgi:hypothetical protein
MTKRIATIALALGTVLGTVAVTAVPASATSTCHPARPGGSC